MTFTEMTRTDPRPTTAALDRLEAIVDLDRYPIHRLDHPVRAELVAAARAEMATLGCHRLSDFVRPEAVAELQREAAELHPLTYWSAQDHNPYATPDDPSFPEGHPRRFFQHRSSGFVNSDLLPPSSPLNTLYDSDVLTHFVWEGLGVDRPIYRWADPLGRNPYGVMDPGHELPWHFDGNEFTVSILAQAAEAGGTFEYVPDIRAPGAENYERVQAILEGSREGVHTLDLRPGDLQLFRGRFTMHRVTRIEGTRTRFIGLPTYVFDPYRVNEPFHSINFYGRATELHHERSGLVGDGLTS